MKVILILKKIIKIYKDHIVNANKMVRNTKSKNHL